MKHSLKSHAFYAIFKNGHVEVDQEASFYPGQFEVGEKLGFMNGLQISAGFQFKNQLTFHDQIQTVSTVNSIALVEDRQWFLAIQTDTMIRQLVTQALFISGFE